MLLRTLGDSSVTGKGTIRAVEGAIATGQGQGMITADEGKVRAGQDF